jgi:hypothetical protein
MRNAESGCGKALPENRFLEGRNEMTLHPGWPRQSRFAGFESHRGRAVRALAAERNDQHGIDALAQITRVERHYQDPK